MENESEKLIMKLQIEDLANWFFIKVLPSVFYRETGEKLDLTFVGSKGYLSHIELSCEGIQTGRTNIIWLDDKTVTKQGRRLKKKKLEIWHSHENGIRVQY